MTKHPHADILIAIAEGKPVEWRRTTHEGPWKHIGPWNPYKPEHCVSFEGHLQWRIAKKEVAFTGTVKWPAAETVEPPQGTHCYTPSFMAKSGRGCFYWRGDERELQMLKDGLVHLTTENADLHTRALIAISRLAL